MGYFKLYFKKNFLKALTVLIFSFIFLFLHVKFACSRASQKRFLAFPEAVFQNYALAPPVQLKIELFPYFSKGLIKGFLSFTAEPNQVYLFNVTNFEINKVKIGGLQLKTLLIQDNLLKIISSSKKRVVISFKKYVNFYQLPFSFITPLFPYPQNALFSWKIFVYVPKKTKSIPYLLIPYERFLIKTTKYYKCYIFSNLYFTQSPPPLISGDLKKAYSFSSPKKNFYLNFYVISFLKNAYFPELFKRGFWKDLFKGFPFREKLFPGLNRFFIILFPESLNYTSSLFAFSSSRPFISPQLIFLKVKRENSTKKSFLTLLEREIQKNQIMFGLNWKNSLFGKTFAEYVTTYLPLNPQKRRSFRKELLLKDTFQKTEKSRVFFYFITNFDSLERDKFLKEFRAFYNYYLFDRVSLGTWEEFWEKSKFFKKKSYVSLNSFVKTRFSISKSFLIPWKNGTLLLSFKLSKNQDSPVRCVPVDIVFPYGNRDFNNSIRKVNSSVGRENQFNNQTFLPFNNTIYEKVCFPSQSDDAIFLKFLNKTPSKVFLDREYKIFRDLSPSEISLNFKTLLYSSGFLWFEKRDFPKIREALDFFRNLGYKVFPSPKDSLSNLIYINTCPVPEYKSYVGNLSEKEKFFYFGIYYRPFNVNLLDKKVFFACFVSNDFENFSNYISILKKRPNLQKLFVKNGQIILEIEDKGEEGIEVPLFSQGISQKEETNFKTCAIPLKLTLSLKNLISFLDSKSLIFMEFPQNEESFKIFEEFLRLFKDKEPDLLVLYYSGESSQKEEVRVLKIIKELKIQARPLKLSEEVYREILSKGIVNVPSRILLNLPQIDLFHPAFKEFLKRHVKLGPSQDFEKYFEAEMYRFYAYRQEILKNFEKFPGRKILVLLPPPFVFKKIGIPETLKIKNLEAVILFSENVKDVNYLEFGDYLLWD